MKKIMFTCLGNICRSPLAHTLFENLAEKEGLDILVDSSAVGSWNLGQSPDPRMQKVANAHGFVMDHRAKQITKKDLERFDAIFSMAEDVTRSIIAHFDPELKHQNKVLYFRHFDPLRKNENDVDDPYFGDEQGFENAYQIIERTCKELFRRLKEKENPFE